MVFGSLDVLSYDELFHRWRALPDNGATKYSGADYEDIQLNAVLVTMLSALASNPTWKYDKLNTALFTDS